MKILFKNLADTKKHAAKLAAKIKSPAVIILSGDLGAGKTEWVRAFIRAYLKNPKLIVHSPTYSLVNVYEKGKKKKVVHMDLYRIAGADDLESIGFWDFIKEENILCAEWGERIPKEGLRGRDVYYLDFKMNSETVRELTGFFEPAHELR